MKTQITSFVLDEHQVLDLKKLVDIDRRWMEFTHGPWRLRGLVIVAGEVLRSPWMKATEEPWLSLAYLRGLPSISEDGLDFRIEIEFEDGDLPRQLLIGALNNEMPRGGYSTNELTGLEASSLATLPHTSDKRLSVYDTQPPFYYEPCAYPLPDLLKVSGWIDVKLSQFKPKRKLGEVLSKGVTNQNLECLTFPDASLDIVITSDVMEHVRLDDRAHREIYRVLKPGGIYLFTVPHDRSWEKTLTRVQVTDPDDPSKDMHLLEPEYHGDTNSDEGNGVLAYRTYGKELEAFLMALGFEVEYGREDYESLGIMNTELFYCRKGNALGSEGIVNVC